MDENVIFNQNKTQDPPGSINTTGESSNNQIPTQAPSIPQSATPPVVVPASVTPIPPQGVPAGADGTLPKPPSQSILPKILKIVGALIAVLLVVFLIIRFVVPFFGEKEAEKVTLTYWSLWEDKSVMQGLINDFQRENPSITIEYIRKDIKQYRQSLSTQLSEGSGPDIYRFHNSWVGMMSSFLSPLSTDVVSPEDFKQIYFPVVSRDLIRNGGIYGIPLGFDTLALFVNTDIFESNGTVVPKTWDDFILASKALTVKNEAGEIQTAGAALGTYDNINHAPDIIALLMAQNGTDFSNFDKTKANAAQAIEFYRAFSSGEGSVWAGTLDPSLVAFAKGNLAMYFGYSWDIFALSELNKELKYTVHPVPSLPGREMSIASYWVEGVSSKSPHQKEAMLFMKYLAQRTTAEKFYTESAKTRTFGELYARKDLAQTLQNNTQIYPFVSQGEKAVSSYFVSDTYDDGINTQMNTYLGNTVRSVENTSSIQTAVDTLAQGVSQVLSKYGRW